MKMVAKLPVKDRTELFQATAIAMQNMIYGNMPEFEEILDFLETLQEEIHGLQDISPEEFGCEMEDGRLTEPSDGKTYNLREAIRTAEKLGRPLTDGEMKQFEV